MSRSGGAPRDRRVVLIVAALVAAVLAVSVVSAFVPGFEGAFASWPVVVLVLVVGTAVVLFGVLRR